MSDERWMPTQEEIRAAVLHEYARLSVTAKLDGLMDTVIRRAALRRTVEELEAIIATFPDELASMHERIAALRAELG